MSDEQKPQGPPPLPQVLPNPFMELVKQGHTPAEAVKILEAERVAKEGGAVAEAKAEAEKEAPKPEPQKVEPEPAKEAPKAVLEPIVVEPKFAWSGTGKKIPLGPLYPKRMWDVSGIHAVRVVQSAAEERSLGRGWTATAPTPAQPTKASPILHAKRVIPTIDHPHQPELDSIHATAIIPKVTEK